MSAETDFHWGIASSAFQTEGAWNIDGKGPSVWDVFSRKKNKILNNERADHATDFYFRYQQDLDLIAALGIPNFRWSISWPRVIPNGYGEKNYKGLDFYDRLVDDCLARNINPWVTLYHWDLPQALEVKGGWTNRNIIDWYAEYVIFITKKLGDRVKHWMALNEPLAFTGAGYFMGVHAPGRTGMSSFLPAMHHAVLAQAEGIRLIRQYCPDGKAGTTFSCSPVYPFTNSPADLAATQRVDALLNKLFIEPLLGRGYPFKELPFLRRVEKYMRPGDDARMKCIPDFAGIQNYTREVVAHSWYTPYIKAGLISPTARNVPVTAMNWEIFPGSLGAAIRKFNDYSELPSIIVTENGAAFVDHLQNEEVRDDARRKFLEDSIHEVIAARKEGCRVDGYFAWSLTDNFEWSEGYRPRFGLVHVDYQSMKRTVKNSGKWYSQFIRNQQLKSVQEVGQLDSESVGQ